jgi:hypothetical protein
VGPQSRKERAPASDRVLAYFSSSDDAGFGSFAHPPRGPLGETEIRELEKWGTLKPVRGLSALKKFMDGTYFYPKMPSGMLSMALQGAL